MKLTTALWSLALSSIAVLTGCSSQTPQSDTAQLPAVTVASVVSGGAGLLTVNGAPLDLSGSSVTVDDEPGSASDVKPGMEIAGSGHENGGKLKMRSVEVRWRIKGTLDAIDTTNNTIDVVGLRASISDTTVLVRQNADKTETAIAFSDLKVGDYLKMAGLPQSDDSIKATRIEVTTASNTAQTDLRLQIRSLDTSKKTFTYGLKSITVDYSKANVVGSPSEGGWVRVKGVRSEVSLAATHLITPNPGNLNPGTPPSNPGRPSQPDKFELKGPISELNTTAKTFKLRDYTVQYDKAIVRGTLANAAIVEVHGTLNSDKTVSAVRVSVEEQRAPAPSKPTPTLPSIKLEGTVSAFDATAKTLKIRGVSINISGSTKYEVADSEVTAEVFWGTNRTDAHAEAIGLISSGTLVASKLEIE